MEQLYGDIFGHKALSLQIGEHLLDEQTELLLPGTPFFLREFIEFSQVFFRAPELDRATTFFFHASSKIALCLETHSFRYHPIRRRVIFLL